MADDKFSFQTISGKEFAGLFHIAYTHPSGGVYVPFGGCDFWPNFLPSILRPLLTLINGGGYRSHQHSCYASAAEWPKLLYFLVFCLFGHSCHHNNCSVQKKNLWWQGRWWQDLLYYNSYVKTQGQVQRLVTSTTRSHRLIKEKRLHSYLHSYRDSILILIPVIHMKFMDGWPWHICQSHIICR